MLKKMLLLCLLALLLAAPALAQGTRVFDRAGLFSAPETAALEALIAQLQQETNMDYVVLTGYDAPLDRSWDYASDFYDAGEFGLDDQDSGMVFFIDMNNRVPTISTAGAMINYFTDSRLNRVLDAVWNDLADGDYADAAMLALETSGDYVRAGLVEGSYQYDPVTGRRLGGVINTLTAGEAGLAVLAGLAVMLIFVFSVQGSYSLKGSTYRYDFQANTDVNLTKDEEQFVRQTVSRVMHAQSGPSGGSGGGKGISVRPSSSGRMHGGGSGRRF